jgi:peptidyl-prolyl cis-trans isomerase D
MAGVMGLIVVSFAIWGIGDIFRGFGRSTAASIGRTELGVEQLRQMYNDRLQQVSRQAGRAITLDQARALGLDRQIIGQVIAELTLDERVRSLRLGVTDAEMAQHITADPSFRGPRGGFDRDQFLAIIRQAGYTEARFVAEQRRQLLRRQLAGTMLETLIPPKPMLEAADRFQNEQRSIDYVLLDRSQAGDVPDPTPEQLAKYFDERKLLFRAPEYRKVTVLSLIPREQAQWIEVSDADAKRAYEDRRARYTVPERRHVQQIVFPNAQEAAAAADRIAKGAKFTDIATERGLSEKDFDLGTVPKTAIIDRAVADAAFALKENEVSAPVQGRFGTAIVTADKIQPEQARSYEEVAAEIKRDLAAERAKTQITDAYDKIEDQRSEGKTLAEAAAGLKLAAQTLEIDRSGRDPSGAPAKALPEPEKLLGAIFSSDVGVDTDPIRSEDGYVWYEVTGISPAHDRSLDEVKDQVQARWRDEEIGTRLRSKATQLLDKVKGGASLADAAAAEHLKTASRTGLKRNEPASPLSVAGIGTVFTTAKDVAGIADAEQPGEQIVFRVTDIVVPTLDPQSEQAKTVTQALQRALADDIYNQYIQQLEQQVGISINQSAMRQVITGTVPVDRDTDY